VLDADFVKSHGLGNDYIVVDAARFGIALTPERVRLLCHRHLGLGSDGVLEVSATDDRFIVKIWNPDGSEAERSGNGLRIAAKFLSEHGYTIEESFTIETAGGPVRTEVYRDAGRVVAVRLEMGRAVIDRGVNSLDVQGTLLDVSVVSVGNPHCVVFGQPQTRERLFAIGPLVENHACFPARINVQLAAPESRDRVRALVWERGAGHTLASGTRGREGNRGDGGRPARGRGRRRSLDHHDRPGRGGVRRIVEPRHAAPPRGGAVAAGRLGVHLPWGQMMRLHARSAPPTKIGKRPMTQ
jgi:diaminopimelate epimerase